MQKNKNDINKGWADSLILNYINHSQNVLIKNGRKNKIHFEWSLDSRINTDTAKYLVFQIGHTFEHKFISDDWIYIDSAKRKFYEYDIINDRLIKQKDN